MGRDYPLVAGELAYDVNAQTIHYAAQLNADQRLAYGYNRTDAAYVAFFLFKVLQALAKTFSYRCLCSYYRAQGKIVVLYVASSGIAVLLLPGGRTAHSRFAIPIDINEVSTCNIGKNTQLADLIRQTSLIIWDEVPMQTSILPCSS